VLAAANIDVAENDNLAGVDMRPYLDGKNDAAPHDALYWRFGSQMAIRQGDWKLVKYDPTVDVQTVGKGSATETRLYNLANDIGETKDLIDEEPEKAHALQSAWNGWNESNVPPAWGKDGIKAKKAKGRKQRQRAAARSSSPSLLGRE
jgi:arylsulfatase A-like enzyme